MTATVATIGERRPSGGGMTVAAASLALRRIPPPPFLVAEAPNGPRFPNGYVPAEWTATSEPVAAGSTPASATHPVSAARWWDPTVRVDGLDEERVASFLAATEPITLPQPPEAGIGWGPGLTPAGDDVVVGMLLAHHAVGAAERATELAATCAGQETTPLSRSLLDHAARAEAVRPLLDLLRALAGRGDVEHSLIGLRAFGATSGLHLIDGVRRVLVER